LESSFKYKKCPFRINKPRIIERGTEMMLMAKADPIILIFQKEANIEKKISTQPLL
jgi:hypothetical protein